MKDKKNHALWLNTLSFLEYIGCRKIIKSQHASYMNFTLLSHMVEEARHSFFFRKLAKENGLEDAASFSSSYLLGHQSAENYFQRLDKGIEKKLQESLGEEKSSIYAFLNYCYSTLLVELRAVQVYSIYEKLLRNTSSSFSLEGLLSEEEEHLSAIDKELKEKDSRYMERKKDFQVLEEKLFDEFWNRLEACI